MMAVKLRVAQHPFRTESTRCRLSIGRSASTSGTGRYTSACDTKQDLSFAMRLIALSSASVSPAKRLMATTAWTPCFRTFWMWEMRFAHLGIEDQIGAQHDTRRVAADEKLDNTTSKMAIPESCSKQTSGLASARQLAELRKRGFFAALPPVMVGLRTAVETVKAARLGEASPHPIPRDRGAAFEPVVMLR